MGYAILSRILALLLLAAAVLKGLGTTFDPVPHSGILSMPGLPVVLIAWEAALAGWLLWGRAKVGAWAAVLVTFLIFAAASYHAWAVGQSSCGCFGRVRIAPWYVLAFDLGVVLLLLCFRPDLRRLWVACWERRAWFRGVAAWVAGWFVVLGIVVACVFGSLGAAIQYFTGKGVTVDPSVLVVEAGAPGEVRGAVISVTNRAAVPVRLIGGTSDCTVEATHNMPVTLRPGETRQLDVFLRLPPQSGTFLRTVAVWTDLKESPSVQFRVRMMVAGE